MTNVHKSLVAAAIAATALLPSAAQAASSTTQLPLAPLQPLPGPLPAAQLEITDLQLHYYTQYERSDGTTHAVVHPASFGVSKALDVDGNGTADLDANLTKSLQTVDAFELRFTRRQSGTLPVAVEAVVNDPTTGNVLPRDKVAFGYDGRAAGAPQIWTARIQAGSQNDQSSIDVTTSISGAGASLRTLGGIFNGTPQARTAELGGGVDYAAVPTTALLGLTLGNSVAEVRAGATGASTPVTASADVQIGQTTSKRVTATVGNLPSSLRVRHDSAAGTVRYWTSAAGTNVGLRLYESGRTWMLDATGLPQEVGVTTGTTRTTAQVGNGKISSVTVGVAKSGAPQLLGGVTDPYVNATPTSTVVQLRDLQQVVVDTVDGMGAEVQLGAGNATSMRAVHNAGGKLIDGTLYPLPRHFRVAYTPRTGQVFYNGFGTTISWASLYLGSSTPFFGAVSRIYGRVDGLPPSVTLNFGKGASGGPSFTATPMVKKVQADFRSAWSKGDALWYPDFDAHFLGAYLRQVPNRPFRAFLRLKNVSGGELSQVDGRLKATLRTAPQTGLADPYQDVKLLAYLNKANDAVTDDTRIDGFIRDLPPVLTVDQTIAGQTTFTGNRPIPHVKLYAWNLPTGAAGESLRGRILNADVTLTNLPQRFTVRHSDAAQGVEAPTSHFGTIEFYAWDDSGKPVPSDQFPNYVILDKRDGALKVWGRVHGVRKAVLDKVGGTRLDVAFGVAQHSVEFLMKDNPAAGEWRTLTAALLHPTSDAPTALAPAAATLTLVDTNGQMHARWQASSRARAWISLVSKSLHLPFLQAVLPTNAEFCVGAAGKCGQKSLDSYPGVGATIPNDVTMFTRTTSTTEDIRVVTDVCLPAEGTDSVYLGCSRRVDIEGLRLRNARLEFGKASRCNWAGECDDLLKLYVDTDAYGFNVDNVFLNWKNLRLWTTSAVRNVTVGTPFAGVSHIGAVTDASSEYRSSQIRCGGLHATAYDWRVGDVNAKHKIIPRSWCG